MTSRLPQRSPRSDFSPFYEQARKDEPLLFRQAAGARLGFSLWEKFGENNPAVEPQKAGQGWRGKRRICLQERKEKDVPASLVNDKPNSPFWPFPSSPPPPPPLPCKITGQEKSGQDQRSRWVGEIVDLGGKGGREGGGRVWDERIG